MHRIATAIVAAGALGLVYAALASLMMNIDPTWGSAFWPAAGVTFAVLVRSERSRWFPLLVAVALAEFLVDLRFDIPAGTALWGSAANTVEPLVGASAFRWAMARGHRPDRRRQSGAGPNALPDIRSLLLLLGLGAVLGPAVGAVLGGMFVADASADPALERWLRWFVGDAVGVIAVAPALLAARMAGLRARLGDLAGGIVALAAASAAFAWAPGQLGAAAPYLAVPPLLWLALRLGTPIAAIATSALALVVHASTATGLGTFADVDASVVVAQVYIGVVSLSTLTIAVLTDDLVAQRVLERSLLHRALHDPLTGAGNRALLESVLDSQDVMAVIAIDVDDFKTINDRRGHAAGDAVLQEVAHRLASACRPEDVVIRTGGDEFVVLLTGDVPTEAVTAVANRIREALGPPVAIGEDVVDVRASLGSAHLGRRGDVTALLRSADRAMYADKPGPARGAASGEAPTRTAATS